MIKHNSSLLELQLMIHLQEQTYTVKKARQYKKKHNKVNKSFFFLKTLGKIWKSKVTMAEICFRWDINIENSIFSFLRVKYRYLLSVVVIFLNSKCEFYFSSTCSMQTFVTLLWKLTKQFDSKTILPSFVFL